MNVVGINPNHQLDVFSNRALTACQLGVVVNRYRVKSADPTMSNYVRNESHRI